MLTLESTRLNVKELFLTHHNKLWLLKTKIRTCYKWIDVCYILRSHRKSFRGGVIYFASYILNMVPTKSILFVTLRGKGSGKIPYIGYFWSFGCECWVDILENKGAS